MQSNTKIQSDKTKDSCSYLKFEKKGKLYVYIDRILMNRVHKLFIGKK